jgi:hypothetical protein
MGDTRIGRRVSEGELRRAEADPEDIGVPRC